MAEVGYASLGIIPSFDGFERNLQRGASGPMASVGGASGRTFGDAAGKTAGSRFGSAFKTAAKVGLIGIGALGVGAFKLAGDAVSAASDLEESTNKVRQVFGKGAEDVLRFSSKAADALGQTNVAARDAASTFGLFGNLAGLSDRKSAKFSKRMTTLASDLASFHNTEPEVAVEALGAALRGESEPIRSFGVLLDEATLKAEAMRMGLIKPTKDRAKIKGYQVAVLEGQQKYNDAVEEFGGKSLEALKAEANLGTARDRLKKATEGTIEPLTQQQKVLAAQSAIFEQTEVAQGDFARTSDGLANQQRRMKARFEDAKAELGEGLLPIMTDAADWLLTHGIPAFERFSDWFTETGMPAIKDFGDRIGPVVEDNLPKFKSLLGDVRDVLSDAAPFAQNLVDAFTNMPGWAKKAIIGGGLAAIAGKKVGLLGSGGGRGAVGGATSALLGRGNLPARPLYVWAVNGGVGDGGAPGGGKGGWVSTAGRAFGVVAGAAIVSGLAAAGIMKLQKELAPKAAEKGIAGTPYNAGFNGLLDDLDKSRDGTKRLRAQVDLLNTSLEKTKGPYRTGIYADQLPAVMRLAKQYDGILEGIPREVRTTFVQSVQGNNVVSDIGGNGGRTPRATTNDNRIIINGDIRPNNFNETERHLRGRQRARSGGGR